MKWIFISLACGVVGFMMYSTYSNINSQLRSSAIGKPEPVISSANGGVSVEKIEKTLTNTQSQIKK